MSLDNIQIVLVRPQHPGNIGGVARAMKNMGLSALTLVAPRAFPSAEAHARAAGAEDILAAAQVVSDVPSAVAACHLVVATSARARKISWPPATPREAARILTTEADRGPVAVLFGAERTGLSNDEVDFAHTLVQIPVNPAFPSLNLASAVQILCYEIWLTTVGPVVPMPPQPQAAPQEELNRFFQHLEKTLVALQFLDPKHPRKLMRRLVRLFRRAAPDQNEINILRGILTAIDKGIPRS